MRKQVIKTLTGILIGAFAITACNDQPQVEDDKSNMEEIKEDFNNATEDIEKANEKLISEIITFIAESKDTVKKTHEKLSKFVADNALEEKAEKLEFRIGLKNIEAELDAIEDGMDTLKDYDWKVIRENLTKKLEDLNSDIEIFIQNNKKQ